jgi:hypothetical protein
VRYLSASQIYASAEVLACARQNYATDAVARVLYVGQCVIERLEQLLIDSVADVGAIEREPRDVFARVDG